MAGKLFITGMRVVPKKTLSKVVRRLASIDANFAVKRFAARYGASVEEAEKPIEEYTSVLDFFTRRLKPGLRPVAEGANVMVCPVDGAFLVGGPIGDGQLFQAKGKTFRIESLVAEEDAQKTFNGGSYFTLYLAPKDYHRIHSPVDGAITGYTYLPGRLFPVNPAAVENVDALFATNERLITHIDSTTFGRVDVIKVGATCVGHIKVAYDDSVATNVGENQIKRHRYDTPIPIGRGDEVGVFEMGSTVIVLSEKPVKIREIASADAVLLGEAFAELTTVD